MAPHLELLFPHLQTSPYSVESEQSVYYNCIAWAAGVTDDWWWPEEGSHWPIEPKETAVRSFVLAFAALGYEPCEERALESGYEKVAIYADAGGIPTHMARQLPTGLWTSKCGKLEDIIHALEG